MRKTAALLGAGAIVAASAALAVPAQAQSGDAQLSVLHGIPGAVLDSVAGTTGGVVDVYVNDALTINDFKPGSIEGPLPVPAGDYKVDIVGGAATDNSAPALSVPLTLEAGKNYTAVAHLKADASGATATLFPNDTEAAGAGKGKLTARHVAAAPEVEVFVAGGSVGKFTNPNQIGPATLDAGSYDVEVKLPDGTPVKSVPGVAVNEGVNTIAYAWGTADDLQIAAQTVNLSHSAPSGVPGGESGSAATTIPGWIFLAAGVGAAGVALSGRRLATARK
jgi:hypothetical protein